MKDKTILLGILLIILILIGLYFSGIFDATPIFGINKKDKIVFTDKRPSQDNENVLLCIPAAYSDDKRIIGHYSIGKGRKGTSDFRYTTIHLDNQTYFQQASLVKNHSPKTFTDNKRRYRRALCKKNDFYFIVHSKSPITLNEFALQLAEYDTAWNLDMGTYSYGWYKDENGRTHYLGLSTFWNRNKQTNWIVVYKNTH